METGNGTQELGIKESLNAILLELQNRNTKIDELKTSVDNQTSSSNKLADAIKSSKMEGAVNDNNPVAQSSDLSDEDKELRAFTSKSTRNQLANLLLQTINPRAKDTGWTQSWKSGLFGGSIGILRNQSFASAAQSSIARLASAGALTLGTATGTVGIIAAIYAVKGAVTQGLKVLSENLSPSLLEHIWQQ
jgi:hypothetical protein